ncbi:MAG: hypothetical protein P8Y48_18160, partial [Novosphingobium sp.]
RFPVYALSRIMMRALAIGIRDRENVRGLAAVDCPGLMPEGAGCTLYRSELPGADHGNLPFEQQTGARL